MVIAHVANARFLADGVVEVHGAAARDQEDVAYTPIGKLPCDVVGKLHGRTVATSGPFLRT